MPGLLRWTGLSLMLVAGCLLGCDRQPSTQAPDTNKVSTVVIEADGGQAGKRIPPVLLEDIQKIKAQAKADNKILVLDFWATWCVPCIAMFPDMHDKLPALSDQIRVVSITLDAAGEYEARAYDFLEKHHALKDAYRIGGEPENWGDVVDGLGKDWHDLQVPAILVFSPDGVLWDEFINKRANSELILKRVEELVQTSQR